MMRRLIASACACWMAAAGAAETKPEDKDSFATVDVTWQTLPMFCLSNVGQIDGSVRGIAVEHHGLGCGQFKENQINANGWLAEKGIVYIHPHYSPWAWMNRHAVKLTDDLVSVVKEHYRLPDDVPIVSYGGSMGGQGCLIWPCYSRHRVSAVVANCPVTDLVYHYSERPDLPRTMGCAFEYADDLAGEIRRRSPFHQIGRMPDIPYTILHGTKDDRVSKRFHSDRFVAAMRQAGRTVAYEASEGMGHVKLTPHTQKVFDKAILAPFEKADGNATSFGGTYEAVSIDVGRQLFVDDWLIASTQGVVRVFNHPVKTFDAPVMWPETDLEREVDPARPYRLASVAGATSGGLWWDPTRKVFRLWYESGWMKHLCIAESVDGLTWKRPDCGQVPGTNRVLTDALLDSWSVFPDYASADPYANWRLFVSLAGGVTDNRLYVSDDGYAWSHIGNAGQSGDRSTMFYDPFRRKWVFSLRGGGPAGRGRNRSYWASETFGGQSCLWNFTASGSVGVHPDLPCPEPWLATDGLDRPDPTAGGRQPELYNMDAVAYESILLGLFEILHPFKGDNDDCANAGLPKITDLHFAYSRDGKTFLRPDRTAAIPASRWGSGKWDTGYLSPMGGICVIKDERLWFYYSAMRGDARERTPYSADPKIGWRRNGMHFNCSVGVATLRRDGFVGLVADGDGTIVTKPLVFSGRRLFVNAECRFGSLGAEVLDEAGRPIPGFSVADCRTFERRDETKAELCWKGGDLSAFAGRPVRFRFRLACGTFYSFWVSPDKSGKSGGYLAAGGPAYGGLRDL